jgi:hypothetical protein
MPEIKVARPFVGITGYVSIHHCKPG